MVVVALFIWIGPALGCYGGAPLAMGGAYIAQAEDSLAVYWNPAGLAFSTPGFSVSNTLSHPMEAINYDRFIGISAANGDAGIALGYTGLADWAPEQSWLQSSIGFRLGSWNAIGLTYRREQSRASSAEYSWDFGWQFHSGPLAMGLLVQDVGKPWENIRPGIALLLPQVTLALNVYDLKDRNNAFGYCIGAEYWPFKFLALRAGNYLDNMTAGIGLTWKSITLDWSYLGDDLGGVQHVTLGVKF
jgi:hypothetical protein